MHSGYRQKVSMAKEPCGKGRGLYGIELLVFCVLAYYTGLSAVKLCHLPVDV